MLYTCTKPTCGKQYESPEEEAYLCGTCRQEKKAIAAQIDAQFAGKTREPLTSDLGRFEAEAKKMIDPNTGREIFFGRA